MRNYFFISIFFTFIPSLQAGISNELHDLCKDAKDYSGCIEINKNQVSNKLNVADNYNKYPVPRYEDFERCSKITKGLDYPIETCYLKREVEKDIIFEIDDQVVIRNFKLIKSYISKSKSPDTFGIIVKSIDCKSFKEGRSLVLAGNLKNNLPVNIKKTNNKKGEYLTSWTDWEGVEVDGVEISPFPVRECPLKKGFTKVDNIQIDLNNYKKNGEKITFPMFAYIEKEKGTVNGSATIYCENDSVSISPRIVDLKKQFLYDRLSPLQGGEGTSLGFFRDLISKHCL